MASGVLETHPLKLLECPVCYNVFQSKIFMCKKGHNICETCLPHVENCPICKGELTATRNYLVEQLLTKSLRYTCENHDYGCNEKLSLQRIQTHQEHCNYRLYTCLAPKCPWMGQCAELKKHISTKHASYVSTSKEILFCDREYSTAGTTYNEYLFVNLNDELFAYFYKREMEGKILFNVLYIGPTEEAQNFRYALAFQNEDRSKKMQLASNVSTDMKNLFPDCCLSLDYNTCNQFVRYNGVLQYFLKIERQGHKKYEIFEDVKWKTK